MFYRKQYIMLALTICLEFHIYKIKSINLLLLNKLINVRGKNYLNTFIRLTKNIYTLY